MLKRAFQYLGLFILVLFSFFYTEKAITVVKNVDPIMIKINEEKDKYKIDAKDAHIEGSFIVPGIYGKKVNEDLSYKKMKLAGNYYESMLAFDFIKPSISISDNYDKYISLGNKGKNSVSIIIKVNDNDNIKSILHIFDKLGVNATFFIDAIYFEENPNVVNDIIKSAHEIYSYGINGEYDEKSLIFQNNVLETVTSNYSRYCYTDIVNDNVLNTCLKHRIRTIVPDVLVENNPLTSVKNSVKSGSIISFDVTSQLNQEIELIIKFLKSKGLEIRTLDDLLDERL